MSKKPIPDPQKPWSDNIWSSDVARDLQELEMTMSEIEMLEAHAARLAAALDLYWCPIACKYTVRLFAGQPWSE